MRHERYTLLVKHYPTLDTLSYYRSISDTLSGLQYNL